MQNTLEKIEFTQQIKSLMWEDITEFFENLSDISKTELERPIPEELKEFWNEMKKICDKFPKDVLVQD